jgi:hypothetical protein
MQQSIIVQHTEGGDWALVLVATRSEYGRRSITPMLFACKGCGIFAVAPSMQAWTKAGLVFVYDPPEDRREEILANAVKEFVRQVSLRSYIAERASVGIVARAKARGDEFNNPPEGFELSRDKEPAFYWLWEKTDVAEQAMRIARYLINKNHIGDLTQDERDAIGHRLLTLGGSLKSPNAPRNIWRQK